MNKLKLIFMSLLVTSMLLVTSCGGGDGKKNIEIPGVKGPTATFTQDEVLISMVFENLEIMGGARYILPKMDKSYIELSPALEGGTLMAINLGLDDLFGGDVEIFDPQKLPGGRNLPGIPGGNLPAIAFSIEKFHNMKFYVGQSVFGFFIPIKDSGIAGNILSFPYYVKDKYAGVISLVGQDEEGENAGILLLLNINEKQRESLKKLSERY